MAGLAPPWALPGDLPAQLYVTANCRLWLAQFGSTADCARKVANFLRDHIEQDGHLPSFLHTHWFAGGLRTRLAQTEMAEQVFDYLTRRLNDLAESNLSWLIIMLRLAGVNSDHPLVDGAALFFGK